MNIEVGQEFDGVLAKSIIDPKTNRLRVIALSNQNIPEGIFIECLKSIRESNPIGTIFKINVKVTQKPNGRKHVLSRKKKELLTVEEWNKIYG